MDLETLLVSLYVFVDDWWKRAHPPSPRKPGRPPSLSASEVITLAILAQWPRLILVVISPLPDLDWVFCNPHNAWSEKVRRNGACYP